MALTAPYLPVPVTEADLAFPASVRHLMPEMCHIPDEFSQNTDPWVQWFRHAFYNGVCAMESLPRAGISAKAAMRHIRVVMGSFEPKHEHKSAAVAFLMDKWFSSARYKIGRVDAADSVAWSYINSTVADWQKS